MKKLLLAAALLVGGGTFAFGAQHDIPMQIIREGSSDGGNTLAPPRPWYIIQ